MLEYVPRKGPRSQRKVCCHLSQTYLIEKPSLPSRFLAVKILSVDSTIALQNGFIHELLTSSRLCLRGPKVLTNRCYLFCTTTLLNEAPMVFITASLLIPTLRRSYLSRLRSHRKACRSHCQTNHRLRSRGCEIFALAQHNSCRYSSFIPSRFVSTHSFGRHQGRQPPVFRSGHGRNPKNDSACPSTS